MRKLKLNTKFKYLLIFSIVVCCYLLYKPYYDYNNHRVELSSLVVDSAAYRLNLSRVVKFKLESRCLCRPESIEVSRLKEAPTQFEISINDLNETYAYKYRLSEQLIESTRFTCDLYNSFRRGPNQRVVAYSILDYSSTRRDHYMSQLRLASTILSTYFPGWIIRVYHSGESLNDNDHCELQCLRDRSTNKILDNIDLCSVNKLPMGLYGTWSAEYMFPSTWRWLPIVDDFVNIFLSRRLDNCINQREISVIYDWMLNYARTSSLIIRGKLLFYFFSSDYFFLFVWFMFLFVCIEYKDHPSHLDHMIGDLWALKTKLNASLSNEIFNAISDQFLAKWYRSYGNDEAAERDFLTRFVWPLVQSHSKIYDSYNCLSLKSGDPFPTKRDTSDAEFCFVGATKCCDYDNLRPKKSKKSARPLDNKTRALLNEIKIHNELKSSWPKYDDGYYFMSINECPTQCRPKDSQNWIYC